MLASLAMRSSRPCDSARTTVRRALLTAVSPTDVFSGVAANFRPVDGQLWTLHCILRLPFVLGDCSSEGLEELSSLCMSGTNLLAIMQQVPTFSLDRTKPGNVPRDRADFLRTYSFAAALVLLLNAMAGSRGEVCAPKRAQRECLVQNVIAAASEAQMFQPLGSLGSTWALVIAWAFTEVTSERQHIEDLIFRSDAACINTRTQTMMRQAEEVFAAHRSQTRL